MCIIPRKTTRIYKDKRGVCYGWKIFKLIGGQLHSVYEDTGLPWQEKIWLESNGINNDRINYGFHIFTTLKDAIRAKKHIYNYPEDRTATIRKVYFRGIKAKGIWGDTEDWVKPLKQTTAKYMRILKLEIEDV